jgi:hypothetical protein
LGPNSPAARAANQAPNTITKRQRYQKLWAQLDTDRQSFFTHWKDLNDYIMPRRGRFLITDRNRGDRRAKNIIDSTATMAARTMSSGMMSGMTSPARPWKRLTTPDPDLAEYASVKDWLHQVNQRMDTIFLRSNWYMVLPNLYYDLGIFGTAAMIMEEDPKDLIRNTVFPIGSYMLGNDYRGEVRVFMREFGMTVRQIVEKFVDRADYDNPSSWSNISDRVKTLWTNRKTEDWIDVVHAVTINDDYDVTKLDAKYKPYSDCYYEKASVDQDIFLRESGFDEYPILAPRWSVTGEDTYGTDCPGMTTLGDIRQLQLGEKKSLQAIEKMINPPLVGPPSLRNFKVTELPGDISYVTESQFSQLRPLHEISPKVQDLEYKQDQVRQRIKRGFYEDLFLMLAYSDPTASKQPVTAAEIAERHDEKLLALGPVLQQVEQALLKPAIDRVFAVMVRAGDIPEPPKELEGVTLKVEFISIMAQAQKMVGLSGLERFSGYVIQIASAQAAAPESPIWDKFDADESVDQYGDMMGVPPKVVVPDEQVQQVRQQREQQKQIAQASQQGQNALTDIANAASSGAAA